MAKWIAVHTLKKSVGEFLPFWDGYVQGVGRYYAEGNPAPSPAACPKSWNAAAHGRDYVFCIWEADNPEDIRAAIQALDEWVTTDLFLVEEVDWAQVIATAVEALKAEKTPA
jgi:hypothetical protein